MKFSICRIIGNELPPRDEPGSRLQSLKYVLDRTIPGIDHFWIVNHIIDEDYRGKVLELLNQYGQFYQELVFDPDEYKNATCPYERLRYAININPARNTAIGIGLKNHDFSAILDGDCYFTQDNWNQVVATIENDPGQDYYLLKMKRICVQEPEDVSTIPDDEDQIIFGHKSNSLFDPQLCFGHSDKVNLLKLIDCYDFVYAGIVFHYHPVQSNTEINQFSRSQFRSDSLKAFHRLLEKKYNPHYQKTKSRKKRRPLW